jgi:hypothetical protein
MVKHRTSHPPLKYTISFSVRCYDKTLGKKGTQSRKIGYTQVTVPASSMSFSSLVRKVCGLFAADLPPGLEERLKEVEQKIEQDTPDYKRWKKINEMLGEKVPHVSKLSTKLRTERNKVKGKIIRKRREMIPFEDS